MKAAMDGGLGSLISSNTAAVCLSLPSTLSDLWFSSPQSVLTLGCILEPRFTLAAAVVAGEALNWSHVAVVAECHSARANTGWTHPTHHWRCQGPSEWR